MQMKWVWMSLELGEHHRKEFLDSANTIILAAAAARTSRIKLTSAVTVLSAADPVRVFQEFATIDLISEWSSRNRCRKRFIYGSLSTFWLEIE